MNGQSLKDPGISESYRCTATKSTRADEALSAADDDHPVDIQIIVMPYRLQRPECPDTKQPVCLSRGQPQLSAKLTGHFDPLDLARRLEVHQAQCRHAYKLQRQRLKQREVAKELQEERDENDTPGNDGTAVSDRGQQCRNEKGNEVAPTVCGTGPDLMIANIALVSKAKQPGDHRLSRRRSQRSRRRMSIGRASISRASVDQKRTLRGPSYPLHHQSRSNLQQSAGVCANHELERTESKKISQSKPQPFRIYTQEISLGSRQRTTVMNVPDKVVSIDRVSFTGTYVPRHAASGLVRTATQRIEERGKLSKPVSRLSLRPEVRKESSRMTPQTVSHNPPVPRKTASSTKEVPTTDHRSEKRKEAKLTSAEGLLSIEANSQKVEPEQRPSDTTKLSMACTDGERLLPLNDGCAEHKQKTKRKQRRTLRAKISSMILLGRKEQDEDAAPPPEKPVAKPTMSRSRSMLFMLR